MLYKKRNEPFLETDFFNPSSEYRGAPFWAWNCKINEKDIFKMFQVFQEMGMGGAHLHSRTGMDIPYLQEKFMDCVKQSCECAKERDMHVWLYDEDRWPSGYGGGYVTEDDNYRARVLIFSPRKIDNLPEYTPGKVAPKGKCSRSNKRKLVGCYIVEQDEKGWLKNYRLLKEEEIVNCNEKNVWYAYIELFGDNPWFGEKAYADNLNPESVKKFIEITHESYSKSVGTEFGGLIPAIFTDEPQFSVKQIEMMDKDVFAIPFTDDFSQTYEEIYGEDLMLHLPEIFFDIEGEYSVTRYRYYDHLTERFVSAYADQIGKWCEEHNIAMTGHVMREGSLQLQTGAVGEAMRFYRSMQLPGIDMLSWNAEYNTAKQCQSVVHQYGREGMLSELYGVTNWDFDFRGHKMIGDWQAALGVTVRVPHLSWTSMQGEAKRDYPASIGYQSPWYKEYKKIEDYFARINTAMTRGKCLVKLAVLHPIESYWLCYGSEEKTGALRRKLDENFDQLTRWLLGDAKDFDLIAESLVNELYKGCVNGKIYFGEMAYSTILVPNMLTMRSETLKMLKKLKEVGGRVVFTGDIPEYLDGIKSEEIKKFVEICEWIPFEKNSLLDKLKNVSELELIGDDGIHTENLLTQVREDGEERWIFIAHKPITGQEQIVGAEAYSPNCLRMLLKKQDRIDSQKITVKIKGSWQIRIYDAWNTDVADAVCEHDEGFTYFNVELFSHDSLLLRLVPYKCFSEKSRKKDVRAKNAEVRVSFNRKVNVTLSEPNIVLLDMAEYAFDEDEWHEKEEILRVDNLFRERLHMKYRMEAFSQPWVMTDDEIATHRLRLRFRIYSETVIDNVKLALEQPENCQLVWNGECISNVASENYVDRDIFCVTLGKLVKGENILLVTMPFKQKTNVEAMYLLGDFGVNVCGDEAKIIEAVRKMHFGSWTMEGLPFYGGNVTYHIPIEGNGYPLRVRLNKFRSPVIAVDLDGKRQGIIAISPYDVVTEPVKKGKHILDITVYGNRFNTFGALHNTDAGTDVYCGPNFWRSKDELWSYEYQLKSAGPLMSPIITEIREN